MKNIEKLERTNKPKIICCVANPPLTIDETERLNRIFTMTIADIVINRIETLPETIKVQCYEDIINSL